MAEDRNYWQQFWQRRLTRRRILKGAALGGAGLAAAAVIGCGGEEEKPAATPAARTPGPATPAAATPAAATPTPLAKRPGGRYVSYDIGDPPDFNQYKSYGYRQLMLVAPTNPQLLKIVGAPKRPFKDIRIDNTEGDAAEKWEQPDKEGLTYIFKIRPNAKWENRPPTNGRDLTAEDVKWNAELFLEKHPNRSALKPFVTKVEAVDPKTVKFTLSEPVAPFPLYMGHYHQLYLYERGYFESGAADKEPRGAGPFLFDKYEVGQAVTYKRNPDYWLPDKPRVDEFVMRIVPDPTTVVAGFRSGDIDGSWFWWLSKAQLDDIKKAVPDIQSVGGQATTGMGVNPNLNHPAFKDERVRQAFSMAMDRDAIVKAWGLGDLFEGWSSAFPVWPFWWLNPQDEAKFGPNAKFYKNDVAEAKKLLAAAGFPDGVTDVKFYSGAVGVYGPVFKSIGELIHDQFQRAGVLKAPIEERDFAAFYATVFIGKHDGISFTRNVGSLEANLWLSLIYNHEGASSPIAGRELLGQDQKLIDLRNAQRRELNTEKRRDIVFDIQRHLAQKMYYITVPEDPLAYAARPNVQDWWPMFVINNRSLAETAWVKKA